MSQATVRGLKTSWADEEQATFQSSQITPCLKFCDAHSLSLFRVLVMDEASASSERASEAPSIYSLGRVWGLVGQKHHFAAKARILSPSPQPENHNQVK